MTDSQSPGSISADRTRLVRRTLRGGAALTVALLASSCVMDPDTTPPEATEEAFQALSARTTASTQLVARHSNKCMYIDVAGLYSDGSSLRQWDCQSFEYQRFHLATLGDGYYEIRAAQSQKCLDVWQGSTANGAQIAQSACNGGNNQKFKLVDRGGGYYNIMPKHSDNLCLDVWGAGADSGAFVKQGICHSGDNQQFRVDLPHQTSNPFVAKHSGKCLARTNSGSIVQEACDGTDDRRFRLTAVGATYYNIVNEHSRACVEVKGSSLANGAEVGEGGCAGDNQKFQVKDMLDGSFELRPKHNPTMCLDVWDASQVGGGPVKQGTCNNGNNQRFQLPGRTFYKMKIFDTNLCVDVYLASMADNAPITEGTCHGGDNQRFELLPQGSKFGDADSGYYQIVNKNSGKCLQQGSGAEGSQVVQSTCQSLDSQMFKAKDMGNGRFSFQAMHSDRCLDAPAWQNDGPLTTWGCHGGNQQLITLESSTPEEALVARFAPRLRFDSYAWNFPMSAQLFYEQAVANGQNGVNKRVDSWSYGPASRNEIPTYYQVTRSGTSVRIRYWWFYGYQHPCFPNNIGIADGSHNGDWENVIVDVSGSPGQESITMVTFEEHGEAHPHTGFSTEDGTHPAVFVGKFSHGSNRDQGGTDALPGLVCAAGNDFRNNDSGGPYDGSHMDTWNNLVSMQSYAEPWMVVDRTAGDHLWGYGDSCSRHPTREPPSF